MNLFTFLDQIYQKKKDSVVTDMSTNIVLTKWLSFDASNLKTLKKILTYLFYIEPLHYYYLLYFNIVKKNKTPFLNKSTKIEIKDDKLLNKIQYIMGWSNRELSYNMEILTKCILIDRKRWNRELGVS